MNNYLKKKLTYTDDGRLLQSDGFAVMMDWEDGLMKESARVICENNGRVLNIGFGLGIVDTYIETYPIEEHWIIEAHPDVLSYMKETGWYDKPNVRIVEGRWQDVLYSLPTFDGIYFDTCCEDYNFFDKMLIPHIPKLLNKHGIFSFFRLTLTDEVYDTYQNRFSQYEMDVSYTDVVLNNLPYINQQHSNIYWNPEITNYRVIRVQNNKKPRKPKTLI